MYRIIYESPIGKMQIVAEENNIVRIVFITSKKLEKITNIKENNKLVDKLGNFTNTIPETSTINKYCNINKEQQTAQDCQKQLEEYFEGKRKTFNVKYKLSGTEFECRVWEELAKIPYSKTVSYKDIAIGIGKEKAVRAVANAIGKNRLGIVIPCHRVIGSNGKLTGFSAETDERTGLELKRELLNLEGNSEWK